MGEHHRRYGYGRYIGSEDVITIRKVGDQLHYLINDSLVYEWGVTGE
jgi:hypothetical protein